VTPEVEANLRTTVASLRVKTSCQELLLLALLPMLQHHQKEAIRERLDGMERGEALPSRLIAGALARVGKPQIAARPSCGSIRTAILSSRPASADAVARSVLDGREHDGTLKAETDAGSRRARVWMIPPTLPPPRYTPDTNNQI
jgi:hypothetical protein